MGHNFEKVRIAYAGPALEDGAMDVNDLAPALIAFAGLVNRANKVIGNEQPVKVLLKADDIKKGSFDVNLELVYTTLEQAKLFVGMSDENGLAALMEVLGWGANCVPVAGFLGGGIFKLIKYMKDKRIAGIDDPGEGIAKITLTDGTTIDVDEKTFKVYLDHESREKIEKVVEPLMQVGIDSFELRNPANYEDKNAVVSVEKDELPYFKTPELSTLDESEIINKQVIYVKIVSIVFDKEQKWRFSDNDITFWAKIDDEDFWRNINNGTYAFRDGDRLKVECEIRQYWENNNLVTKRRITKVLEILKRPTQIKLDFGN